MTVTPVSPDPDPIAAPIIGTLEAIVCSQPWPCDEAILVARCESGTDKNGLLDGNWASNGVSYGLFQLAPQYHDWPDFWDVVGGVPNWADATYNVEHAYALWAQSGTWKHWSCKPWTVN